MKMDALYGAVGFVKHGLADIWFCHCGQYRFLIGHYVAATARREDLDVGGPSKWAHERRRNLKSVVGSVAEQFNARN
jgi:hypothetical protein